MKTGTSSQATDLIRELTQNHGDKQIAASPSEEGLRAGYGGNSPRAKYRGFGTPIEFPQVVEKARPAVTISLVEIGVTTPNRRPTS